MGSPLGRKNAAHFESQAKGGGIKRAILNGEFLILNEPVDSVPQFKIKNSKFASTI